MNSLQCKWLMTHKYDSIEHILEYTHQESITLSTLFCTDNFNAITVTHLKCIIALKLLELFETTDNSATALAYIKRAEEYLNECKNDALSLRIMSIINIKLRGSMDVSKQLLCDAITLYSDVLKEYINSITDCGCYLGCIECSCYVNGLLCNCTVNNSEKYNQLQYSIACCKHTLLRLYVDDREFDKGVQVATDIINMDTRTLFGSFNDSALAYAHKVMATCYRYGYNMIVDISKSNIHYNMSSSSTPKELSLTSVTDLKIKVVDTQSNRLVIPIDTDLIYSNVLNKSLHSTPNCIIVINATITIETSTLKSIPLLLTALCSNVSITYLVDYTNVFLEYRDLTDGNDIKKILDVMYDIVDGIIGRITVD